MAFTLDLTDADTSGFDAIPARKYLAEIIQVDMDETGENSKMGEGIPMLKVRWKITDPEEFENKLQFSQFVLPPDDFVYNVKDGANKLKKVKGMFVRFLLAIGYTEEELQSDAFEVDEDDYIGKEACITVTRYQYPPKSEENPEGGDWRNNVSGVNPVETYEATSSSSLI